MKKYISLVSAFTILLILNSCKTLQNKDKEINSLSLPTSYSESEKIDSINAAEINWREYFEDSLLVGLIDQGLKSNYDLLIAYQKIEVVRANLLLNKGSLFPSLNPFVSLGKRRFGKYTMDGVGNFDTGFSTNITSDQFIPEHLTDYYGGANASWEIDIRGTLRNKKRAAKANYLASVEGKNWLITNLVSEIAKAYYELLALDFELHAIEETSILQKKALEIVLLQKEAGKANELAVEQFEAQYLFSKGLEVDLQQQVIEYENTINFLLGRLPQKIERNPEAFTDEITSEMLVGVPSQLLQNRPDIRQSELELLASRADLKAARAAFYPSFTINATLGLQTFNSKYIVSPESMMYNVLGGLTAPLINRSAIQSEFNRAKSSQIQAMYTYQKTILNAYIEVYNQMKKLENYNKFHTLKSKEVELLKTSVQTSSELFSTGRASYFEIIFSQKNALNSRIQLMEVRKNQFNVKIDLYRALGGGWK